MELTLAYWMCHVWYMGMHVVTVLKHVIRQHLYWPAQLTDPKCLFQTQSDVVKLLPLREKTNDK